MAWWPRLLALARGNVVLSDHYLAFVLLNLGDLFFTGLYFRLGGLEANRLAAWILQAWGLRGLVLYKFALVLTVVVACEALFPRRPGVARGLVLAGCAVYATIIVLQVRGLALRLLAG